MALIALSIASLGIFAVVSYSVALRRKEIGIRLAVGANRFAIVVLILSDLLRTVAPAIVLGVGVSVLGRTVLRGLVFMKTSALVLSGTVALMLACAALAALFPTLRALRGNAIDVLKWDS